MTHYKTPKRSKLPGKTIALYSPIYKKLFEVEFHSPNLTDKDIKILRTNTFAINKGKDGNYRIHCNLNDNSTPGIPVLDALTKLEKFDITVITHNADGEIICLFKLFGCEFVDLFESVIDFTWHVDEILEPEFAFTHKKIKYFKTFDELKIYNREQKLKRIGK